MVIKVTDEEADRFEAVLAYVLERYERRRQERDIQKVMEVAKTMMDHVKSMERAKAQVES